MTDTFHGASKAKLKAVFRRGVVLPNWVRRLGYYWLALLFVAAAVMLRWGLRDALSPTPTLVFYLAWVGAAAFGGLGPGLLATAASWLCIEFLFDSTPGQIGLADSMSVARLLILLGGGLVVSLVGEKMRRTRIRERETRDGLEVRVQDRTAQLRHAKELVESERQRFQNILDQLPAYLVLLTPDYRVPFANRLFEERFGKCEGRRCYEYLFQRAEPCPTCNAYEVLQTHAPQHWEWTGPDGRDYDIYDFPFTDVDGAPLIMEVGLDITERKRAEAELAEHREHLEELVRERTGQLETANEALLEREHQLRSILEANPLGVAMSDTHGRILEANDAYLRIIGRTREDLWVGRVYWDRITPEEHLPRDVQAIAEAQETGVSATYEKEFLRPDGTRVPVLMAFATVGGSGRLAAFVLDIAERKQAEEALRQSERQFKSTFENAAIGIAHVALDGHILQCNSRFCEITGYLPDEILGKTCEQITFAEDWKIEKEQLGRLLDSEVAQYSIEKRYIRQDGRPVWVNLTRSIQHDESGRSEYFIVLVEDISARRRAEEALRAGEYRFRRLFEANLAGVYITKLDGTILDFNDAMMRMLGYESREEVFQHKFTDFYADPEFRALLLHLLHRDGFVPAKEAVLQRQDGSVLYALGSAALLVNEQTGEPYIQGIAIDISERKQAEEALRESETRLRVALNAGRMGTWVWDLATDTVDTDVLHRRLWDLDDADVRVPAGVILQKIHPADRARAFDRASAPQMLDRPFDVEFRVVRRDGGTTWLHGSAAPVRDADGTLRKVIGVNFDITERKHAEETMQEWNTTLESRVAERTVQLQQRTRQLQKLTLEISEAEDRERRRMAEILHDDLQQQLAAAKFHLGLMKSRVKHDESAQATAAQIDHMLMEAIQKSRGLSHELSPAVMHHADFTETLRWLANQIQSKHGLIVRVHGSGEVHAPSDALKGFLYKTVQELLFNVVKHARVDEARIGLRHYNGCICLSVSDRGRGFDPQELRDTAGFGLLNIRERIELLGGRMKIRSARGRGSRFFIMVPNRAASEEVAGVGPRAYSMSQSAGGREGGHEGPPLRVLLADDHEIVRQGLVSLLGEEHALEIVGEAANGREAVDLAERLHPDVIIMDVSMPLIDGDAATRQIKALRPETRVIALSMYEEPAKMEAMRRAGAEKYVLKTVPAEELLAAIRGKEAGS